MTTERRMRCSRGLAARPKRNGPGGAGNLALPPVAAKTFAALEEPRLKPGSLADGGICLCRLLPMPATLPGGRRSDGAHQRAE